MAVTSRFNSKVFSKVFVAFTAFNFHRKVAFVESQ